MSPSGSSTSKHEQPLRVWLDDDLEDRAAPDGWVHVQTAGEAIELLRSCVVLELSLDRDLADDEKSGTGYDVCLFLAEQSEHGHDLWPRETLSIHSANFSASPRMEGVIDRYSPLHRVLGRRHRGPFDGYGVVGDTEAQAQRPPHRDP